MSDILGIVGSILGAVAVGVLVRFAPYIKEFCTSKIVAEFVKAAEQLYHDDDPDGSKRFAYVVQQLKNLGYALTDKLVAYIESAVLDINLNKKTAKAIASNSAVVVETTTANATAAKTTVKKSSSKKNSGVGSTTDKVAENAKDLK